MSSGCSVFSGGLPCPGALLPRVCLSLEIQERGSKDLSHIGKGSTHPVVDLSLSLVLPQSDKNKLILSTSDLSYVAMTAFPSKACFIEEIGSFELN